MTLTDLMDLVAALLPIFTLVAIAGTALVTWLLCGEVARRQARTIRRMHRSVRSLSDQLDTAQAALATERTLVARLTDPAAALLEDVRGTHRRAGECSDTY